MIKTDTPENVPDYEHVTIPMEFSLVKRSLNKNGVPTGEAKFDPAAAVQYLRKRRVVWHPAQAQFYVYDPYRTHVYNPIGDGVEEISRIIHTAVDECTNHADCAPILVSTNTINNIIGKLKGVSLASDLEVEDGFDTTPYAATAGWRESIYSETELSYNNAWEYTNDHLIPFENGLLNTTTDELLPFTPNIFVTSRLHASYEPGAASRDHPAEQLLRKMFPDEDTLEVFLQYVGYTLYTKRVTGNTAAFMVVYGSGGDGKSTLGRMITSLLGQEHVSTLNMDQLTDKFHCYQLGNVRANICEDTSLKNSKDTEVDTSILKSLCVGDSITVQRKFKNPYTIVSPAKLLFFANDVPDFGEVNSAMQRRLLIIRLPGKYKPTPQDFKLLTSRSTLQWFAMRCFDAFCDFQSNDMGFRQSKHMLDELESYMRKDSQFAFFYDTFESTDKKVIAERLNGKPVKELYDNYIRWYREEALPIGGMLGRNGFYKDVQREFGLMMVKKFVRFNGRDTSMNVFVL